MYLPSEQTDYLELLALGKPNVVDDDRAVRVAVLGSCTTQYYARVLRGVGRAVGFPLVTFESEYDTVEQTLLDEAHGLYAFRPQIIVFATAVQAVRDRLLAVPVSQRMQAAESAAETLVSQVTRAAAIPSVSVVVHELVLPYERAWGNLTGQIDGSLPRAVGHINERIRQAASALENVFTVDCDHIASWFGKRLWFDERLWFYGKNACHPDALPHVAAQVVDILRALKGKSLKCIAVDLDNTLWGGVIGDDLLSGIQLGELGAGEAFVRFQRWLKDLSARGILLAVCSKNDEPKAREPFQKHPDMVLSEIDFVAFLANWDNKADNLRRLAKRLNIGLDTIVFLDDNPFERNLVRELVPEVVVPELPEDPADFIPYLEALNLFEATQFSAEDRQRTEFYRTDLQRDEERAKCADIGEYLKNLQMVAAFERFDDAHLPRIAQLVQRTNQFNLTTIRSSAGELKAYASDLIFFPYYITLADRFGDNGLISVVIAKRSGARLEIVSWLMSCRVIARRLEEFVLARLIETARAAGLQSLLGRYVPTAKNGMVASHYEKLGFRPTGEANTWELNLTDAVVPTPPIEWRRSSEKNSSVSEGVIFSP